MEEGREEEEGRGGGERGRGEEEGRGGGKRRKEEEEGGGGGKAVRGWGEKIERERRDERGRDGVGTEGMRGRVIALFPVARKIGGSAWERG